MIDGSRRSSSVIEWMIASTRESSLSLILAFLSSFGIPGSIPTIPERGPIFLICCICSRKSSRVKSPSWSLAAALAATSWSYDCSAFSMRVRTSPMPRIRLAIRSGWNGSKSASFSPIEAKAMGRPTTSLTDRAAPPRASPSSLVRMTPSSSRVAWNASATLTASWPVMASMTRNV